MTPDEGLGTGLGLGESGQIEFSGAEMCKRKLATSMLELEPRAVWDVFNDLCQIPRSSYNEEGVRVYLRNLGATHGWEVREDESGNIVLAVPGKGTGENHSPIVIQAHTDMVCIKDSEVEHDFEKDPIKPVIAWEEHEDSAREVVRAMGTTLGADNGVGLAIGIALAMDDSITDRPPLEILATYAEEVGLDGARELDPSIVKGRVILNLDTEDYGEVYTSCAGSRDIRAAWELSYITPPSDFVPVRINIDGLPGGHSGVEIHKNIPNAVHGTCETIQRMKKEGVELYLGSINGGTKRNAIPSSCEILIWLSKEDSKKWLGTSGPKAEDIEKAPRPIAPELGDVLLDSILGIQHGVIKMSKEVPNLVQTSNNVAIVKTEDGVLSLECMTRSSVKSEIVEFQEAVAEKLQETGATISYSEFSANWKSEPNSDLQRRTEAAFEKVTGKKPEIKGVHAGLECGEFAIKIPDAEIISYGPTIEGAHTPLELVVPSTVIGSYEVTKEIVVSYISNPS